LSYRPARLSTYLTFSSLTSFRFSRLVRINPAFTHFTPTSRDESLCLPHGVPQVFLPDNRIPAEDFSCFVTRDCHRLRFGESGAPEVACRCTAEIVKEDTFAPRADRGPLPSFVEPENAPTAAMKYPRATFHPSRALFIDDAPQLTFQR
jgi:hypothetical protein